MSDGYQVVRDFEAALCEYTGAPYAVTVNSCTMALFLALKREAYERCYTGLGSVSMPKRTYVSVPQSIKHAGFSVSFEDYDFYGAYQLFPTPVFDSAREFSFMMYDYLQQGEDWNSIQQEKGPVICVSFHASKILGDTQGGAILHDDPEADSWFRKARFDGRTEGVHPKDDSFDMLGYHCYMSPDVAARLLLKLSVLPEHNDPLPNDDYPDLSQFEVFK